MAHEVVGDRVYIRVGAGLGFNVSRKSWDEAVLLARVNKSVWFVGVDRDGTEYVMSSRDILLAMGVEQIAWVSPSEYVPDVQEMMEAKYGN